MPNIYNNPDFDYQKMVAIVNSLGISQESFDAFLETRTAEGILDLQDGESSISLSDYRNTSNDFCHKYDNAEECYSEFMKLCSYWERLALKNKSYRIEYPTSWEEYDERNDEGIFHRGHVLMVYHKGIKEKFYYMNNSEDYE